jgi:ribosomal protein L37AE/L43A
LETLTAPVLLRSSCGSCGRAIALVPPRPKTTARIWTCNGCESVFFGAENEDVTEGLSPLKDASRIAVDALTEGGKSVRAQLVSQSHRLVEGLVADAYRGVERRSHARYPVAAPVTGIPLSADFRVVGPALAMMTLNLSSGGIALIHKQACEAPYFALDFADAGLGVLQILLRVLRTSDIGLQHVTAGDFLEHATSE